MDRSIICMSPQTISGHFVVRYIPVWDKLKVVTYDLKNHGNKRFSCVMLLVVVHVILEHVRLSRKSDHMYRASLTSSLTAYPPRIEPRIQLYNSRVILVLACLIDMLTSGWQSRVTPQVTISVGEDGNHAV